MIAIDAMGGDFAPRAVVRGAYQAANVGVACTLYGAAPVIESILAECNAQWRSLPLTVVDCSEAIEMGEAPSRMVLKKKNSSLVRAVQAVADGTADSVVSAGNSGAAVVAGTLIIGRVPGVHRPALGNFLPTRTGSFFCLDLGATVDCKPDYLEQFALMGHVFVKQMTGVAAPRVALLSNGAEPSKGSTLVKSAHELLASSLEVTFVGNVEPRDMFDGRADVLVCDGFAGNIMLKTMQGTASAMTGWIKRYAQQSWWHAALLSMQGRLFGELKKKLDYTHKGGALLLGLAKPVVVAHGCSNETAIMNAILFAQRMVHDAVLPRFNQELATVVRRVNQARQITSTKVAQSEQQMMR